mgnify:CR=1 FL=1
MLVQQGVVPARAVVGDRALRFAAAEARAVLLPLSGGSLARDAFSVPIEVDEIAQFSPRVPKTTDRISNPKLQENLAAASGPVIPASSSTFAETEVNGIAPLEAITRC